MSAKYTFAVYETIVGSATQKLILLKLADNANDDGVCWPGMEYLSRHCELSRSAILRNLKALEAKGLISVKRRKTDDNKANLSNVYRLTLPSVPQLPPSSSQTPPPSSSELPESNNIKPNKESNLSSGDDQAQKTLDIYHQVIDELKPNWAKAKTFDQTRKKLCRKAVAIAKARGEEINVEPLEVLYHLLRAMAQDAFYSGLPNPKSPNGYRCAIEQTLSEKRLRQAIDTLGRN